MFSNGAHLFEISILSVLKRQWIVQSLLVGLLAAPTALAKTSFGGMVGYNQGVLTRSTEEKFTGYSTQGFVGYQVWRGLEARAFFQHMDLAYEHQGEAFTGIYSLSGLGLGYSAGVGRGTLTGIFQIPLNSAYIVLSETTGNVNGKNYIHSTLTALQGGQAFQVIAGYQYRVVGSGKKTSEDFYFGTFLGYLSQTFATQTTRIKTNKSVLAPRSPGSESGDYKVTLLSLNFSVNYDL